MLVPLRCNAIKTKPIVLHSEYKPDLIFVTKLSTHRMDMFFHIASIEREVYWQLGNVVCSAYPLKNLDTIHSEVNILTVMDRPELTAIIQTGELQTNSALNLIVFGPKLEHLGKV